MAVELRDPDRPAGYVVEVDPETGEGIRNDGKRLQPAAKNPWYVLMTIAGEQTGRSRFFMNLDLAARNRRYWNGWACGGMDEAERKALAKKMGLAAEELEPLNEAERGAIAVAVRERLAMPEAADHSYVAWLTRMLMVADQPGADLPDTESLVNLSEIHSSNTVVLEKWIFSGYANFNSARFSGYADFSSARFSGDAGFLSATFSGDAWFRSATFSGSADFGSAMFSGDAGFWSATFSGAAWFNSATFSNSANFNSARFSGAAWFSSATFSGSADFSDKEFGGRTDFADVHFNGDVPEFYGRVFHQNTDIPIRPENWPGINKHNAENAKRAYTRLRQIMNGLHKPDAEAFFGRQEMRCDAFDGGWLNRRINRGYGFVSVYGHSVGRPLAGLAGLIVVFGSVFGSYLMHGLGVKGAGAIAQGLGLSIANTFPYLGFQRLYFRTDFAPELNPWIKMLGGVQTVLGGVLLFLLLLGLRNRFRLK